MWRWLFALWFNPVAACRLAARPDARAPLEELTTAVIIISSLLPLILLVPEHGWYPSLLNTGIEVVVLGLSMLLQMAMIFGMARRVGWETTFAGVFPPYALSMVTLLPVTAGLVALELAGLSGWSLVLRGAGLVWNWFLLTVAVQAYSGLSLRAAFSCVVPVCLTDLSIFLWILSQSGAVPR